jgi:hypothetical protein
MAISPEDPDRVGERSIDILRERMRHGLFLVGKRGLLGKNIDRKAGSARALLFGSKRAAHQFNEGFFQVCVFVKDSVDGVGNGKIHLVSDRKLVGRLGGGDPFRHLAKFCQYV